MLNSTILQQDKSWDSFSPLDGEALSKPSRHQFLMLDVDNSVWYVYHHRIYDPKATSGPNAYDVAKWKAQQ